MTLKAMHFKFAITEPPTIEPVAAPAANGALAVAAFIAECHDTAAIMTLLYISEGGASAAWRVTAAQHLLMMEGGKKTNKHVHNRQ